MKKILIFVICYRTSSRVLKVFKKIKSIKNKKFKLRILISDNNSPDDTITYIKKIQNTNKIFVNFNKKNLGFGGNIKFCLKFAIKKKFDFALMAHGDDQYDPRNLNRLLKKFSSSYNCAAVTGSRMLIKKNALKGVMPIHKFIGNIVLTKIFNILMKTNVTDAHSGLWLYNLKKIKKIQLNKITDGYNFDSQLRLSLINIKYSIPEIPIKTKYADEPNKMHVIYAIRFLLDLLISFTRKNFL